MAFTSSATLKFGSLRNITTGKPVGAQQTTAIVAVDRDGAVGREYVASLIVRLVPPYYAEMLGPTVLAAEDVRRIHVVADAGDAVGWSAMVSDILGRESVPM